VRPASFIAAARVAQRRAVVDADDDDVLVEVERAGRVVDEERQLAVRVLHREQEGAVATAVGILLTNAGA
jgi:hypothetical protein